MAGHSKQTHSKTLESGIQDVMVDIHSFVSDTNSLKGLYFGAFISDIVIKHLCDHQDQVFLFFFTGNCNINARCEKVS